MLSLAYIRESIDWKETLGNSRYLKNLRLDMKI